MNINFKELRDKISTSTVITILGKYGIVPVYENNQYLLFPTCCHNLMGGSHKLYYYINTKMFRCYTECGPFDIFDLMIKLEGLRGRKIGKIAAIEATGLKVDLDALDGLADESLAYEMGRLYELTSVVEPQEAKLKVLDPAFLDKRFRYSATGLRPWVEEGIGYIPLLEYGIRYDPLEDCIIIPQWDENGGLVGVRGRFFGEEAEKKGKYRPIYYNNELLSHPLSKTLYGLYHNRDAIKRIGTCILFEGEKSILKMATIYDHNNVAVATCGQSISPHQIELLANAGVRNIILAFDADYGSYGEIVAKQKEYTRICKPLTLRFNVSIIMDYAERLSYKDSPIDKGAKIFSELMEDRIYL